MIDFAQSQLVVLVAGAILASSLAGVAAVESVQREDLELVSAIDVLAARIASSGCSARSPLATIDLAPFWKALPPGTASVALYPNHIRAVRADGHARASIEFPALAIGGGLELTGALALHLTFEPVQAACVATVGAP